MKKKIFALSLAFVLVIGATFGVTFAWLTANTGTIKNTFTVGKVEIALKEEIDTKTNGSYDVIDASTTNSADYKIVPGTKQHKAPYVAVKTGSEESYVYLLVKNDFGWDSSFVTVDLDTTNWTDISDNENFDDEMTLPENCKLFKYNTTVSGGSNTEKLFTEVSYDSGMDNAVVEGLASKTIQVVAFATQANGDIGDESEYYACEWAAGMTFGE